MTAKHQGITDVWQEGLYFDGDVTSIQFITNVIVRYDPKSEDNIPH